MKRVSNVGDMPKCLNVFMTNVFSGEHENAEVFDCNYDEIIAKATLEKLEPQVIIDKKDTGRSYLCAVGASVRSVLLVNQSNIKPIFYFAELDDSRKKQFQYELRKARASVIEDHKRQLEIQKAAKEAARKGAEDYRNGKARLS